MKRGRGAWDAAFAFERAEKSTALPTALVDGAFRRRANLR
jgi:hypothetical protein